jgi:hypothetical protein
VVLVLVVVNVRAARIVGGELGAARQRLPAPFDGRRPGDRHGLNVFRCWLAVQLAGKRQLGLFVPNAGTRCQRLSLVAV